MDQVRSDSSHFVDPVFVSLLNGVITKEKLETEHYTLTTKTKDGDLRIHCKLCDSYIKTGPKTRGLQYFKVHLKTDNHKQKVIKHNDRSLRLQLIEEENKEEEVREAKQRKMELLREQNKKKLNDKLNEVKLAFKGIFEKDQATNNIICTFCLKKISLQPERGELMANIKTHIASKDHISKATGKRQSLMSTFLSSKK